MMFYKENFCRFRSLISENFDGALISPGSNFYYLTGLDPSATGERLFLLLVPPEGEPIIISPKLYEEELKNFWVSNIIIWEDKDNPYDILKNYLDKFNKEKGELLIEDSLPVFFLIKIQKLLGEYKLELVSSVISELRIKKNGEEIECMRKAAEIVDKVFYRIIEEDLEGRSEKEIAALIEYLIKNFGGVSFDPIVASGPDAANPHYFPTDRKIERGNVVILDYGAKFKGYCSDVTRTVAIRTISEKARKIYEIVKEAQENAFYAVKAEIKARDVDSAARGIINSYGYSEKFVHRTGHGLGLDVHEEPYISPNSEKVLEACMIFTTEPGIYLSGKFGVRIEDDILLGEKGIRLTKADRELRILGGV